MKDLCVITGTSSGIGEAVAQDLLGKGWQVVGISRRRSAIENGNYREYSLDLSDPQAAQEFFEGDFLKEVQPEKYGRVALVNNAATLGWVGPHEQAEPQAMVRDFTLNTVMPIWLSGFFMRHCGNSRLYIVNISTGAANRPVAGWSTYCATKAGLKMAGQVAVQDMEKYSHYKERNGAVSIVSYSPGTVSTAMQAEIREHTAETFPRASYFVDLHESGNLKSADLPAAEIVALLQNNDLPVYSDITYGK